MLLGGCAAVLIARTGLFPFSLQKCLGHTEPANALDHAGVS